MKVYTANEMPNIQSTGPSGINKIGGLMEFNNVCLTKHISGTELEGVILKHSVTKRGANTIPLL